MLVALSLFQLELEPIPIYLLIFFLDKHYYVNYEIFSKSNDLSDHEAQFLTFTVTTE